MDRRGFIQDIITLASGPAFITWDRLMAVKTTRTAGGVWIMHDPDKQIGTVGRIQYSEAKIDLTVNELSPDIFELIRRDMAEAVAAEIDRAMMRGEEKTDTTLRLKNQRVLPGSLHYGCA